jgi:hypothetical protein
MQISASNLLLASQQTQAPAPQQKPAASFVAALKVDQAPNPKPGFDALPLKKAATQATVAPAVQDAPKQAAGTPISRPGANLDIRI